METVRAAEGGGGGGGGGQGGKIPQAPWLWGPLVIFFWGGPSHFFSGEIFPLFGQSTEILYGKSWGKCYGSNSNVLVRKFFPPKKLSTGGGRALEKLSGALETVCNIFTPHDADGHNLQFVNLDGYFVNF